MMTTLARPNVSYSLFYSLRFLDHLISYLLPLVLFYSNDFNFNKADTFEVEMCEQMRVVEWDGSQKAAFHQLFRFFAFCYSLLLILRLDGLFLY